LRILLVTDYGTPTGGVEIMTRQLRDTLAQRGHSVRWFASRADTGGGKSAADVHCFGTTSRFRTLLQTANPMAARALRSEINSFRPDVVHVSMFLTQLSPLILPVLRRVPSLLYVNWYRPICPLGTKMLPDGSPCRERSGMVCRRTGCLPLRDAIPLTFQMKLWRKWSKAFALLVANSETTRRRLAEEGLICDEVVLCGVPERAVRPPLQSPPTVAFAGRLVKEKGIDVLLRAFAIVLKMIPEARLIIAGNGPMRDEVVRLIGELGLGDSVEMPGHVAPPQLERLFGRAWVQAAPSIWAEPFGLVAPEAMMRGTAVVATTGGGLAETVEAGVSGLLVPPGEVLGLADALRTILSDRVLAERMGTAGREIAIRRLSINAFVDQMEAIYRRLAERRMDLCAAGAKR
jgi:glycosyltransferase involved in cell wall biosynthesis